MSQGKSRRPTVAPGKWPHAALVLVVAVLAVLAGVVTAQSRPPATDAESKYAALAPAREQDIAEVLRLLRGRFFVPLTLDDAKGMAERAAAPPRDTAIDALGPRLGPALVRALVRRDAGLDRSSSSWTQPRHDASSHAVAWAFRDCETEAAIRALLVLAQDREMHLETRIPAFVALCRPGNEAALEPLVDIALDPDDRPDVRREVLMRLPRFGVPLPARLRELLDLPFHRLDERAAVVLGATGELESPTLVLRALRSTTSRYGPASWNTDEQFPLALESVRRAVGTGAPEILSKIDTLETSVAKERRVIPMEPTKSPVSDEISQVADAFERWLDAHPSVRRTAWEKAAADPADAERRRAALALATADEIADAPDAAIDVAGASQMLLHGRRESAERVLEDVDRVARWLRPRIAGCGSPRDTLERMQTLLVPRHQTGPGGEDWTELAIVLQLRAGNCLGWSLLFVALGDRLGLPLHCVAVPNHAFVRWDDGKVRVNIDPVNGGAVRTDDEYAADFGGRAALAASPRWLRNLTHRELVASVASNSAAHYLEPDRAVEYALRGARAAVRVDAHNPNARMNLLVALARTPGTAADELRSAAAAAEALPEFSLDWLLIAASSLAEAGLGDDALALLDRHPADGEKTRIARSKALAACGRWAEAREITRPLAEADDAGGATLDAVYAFRVSPAEGWLALEKAARLEERANGSEPSASSLSGMFDRTTGRIGVILSVARGVLDLGPADADGARLALEIADLLDPAQRSSAAPSAPPTVRAYLLGKQSDSRSSLVDHRRDDIRARAWERLGEPERAKKIRDALEKYWSR
jgi:hypothetical protein